jgi:hypothetical protein
MLRRVLKNKLVQIASLVSSIVLIALFLTEDTVVIKPQLLISEESIEQMEPHVTDQIIKTSAAFVKTLDFSNFDYCEKFVAKRINTTYAWFRENHEEWGAFIEQGYSLNDVTAAVEHFGNSNYAAAFRIKQLRKNSEATNFYNQVADQVRQFAPELLGGPLALSFQKPIPTQALVTYPRLTKSERNEILKGTDVSVDDLAFFVRDKAVSDEVLLELLSAISDPNAIVGYDRLETTSVLDYAIFAYRPAVVEELLLRGAIPTNDEYLGTSLDWALSSLNYNWHLESKEQAIKVLMLLKNSDLATGIDINNQSHIRGGFPRHFFDFDRTQINYLLDIHSIDLSSLKQKLKITPYTDSLLIKLLERSRQDYLSKKLALEDVGEHLAKCEDTINGLNDKWEAENARIVVQRIVSEYENDQTQIKQVLNKIDPVLFDMYISQTSLYRRKQEPVNEAWDILPSLTDEHVDQVITSISELTLNEANKNWLFGQILNYGPHYYSKLVDAGFLVDEIQYFAYKTAGLLKVESIKALYESGADLFKEDIRGKTLLYYAVKAGNIELVKYLEDENFPYSSNVRGEDPLHVALNTMNKRLKVENIEGLVDALMEYDPEVDKFHLSRVALIKLKYPDLYQRLAMKHPQLAILPSTPLPSIKAGYVLF